jgi:uncharacterized protein
MTDQSEKPSLKPNRLILEKSPYLLEHAYNPVDWYPWGDEAFQKARREDKPIFLSIGYSACHWCHQFRKESLEDPEIAEFLNSNFVSIKVDREERPDVDEIYMKAATSMIGSGGWPLNVFLTPSLEPFYGGTYFPPVARHGLPSFRMVLKGITDAWKSDKEKILESASEMKQALNDIYKTSQSDQTNLDDSVLDLCFNELASIFDQKHGGFGGAPKFPTPSNLFFLLRYYKKTGSKAPLMMVTKTLDQMSSGGIYDHIGGGFHRYSTDSEWLIPHFEKMLYDNALLSAVFSEAYLVTKDEFYGKVTSETLEWVLREMRSHEGGFLSAQDADSSEGEGLYYVWNRTDVRSALSQAGKWNDQEIEKISEIVCKYFGINDKGNFEGTKSVLTTSKERLENILKQFSTSSIELESILKEAKIAMLEFRSKREKPQVDDKVLVSWNGLMISAMSKAYQVFERKDFLLAAQDSANFILSKLCETKDGKFSKLVHRYRDGDARVDGLLEDYAYFVNGLIDLYESNFDISFLKAAIELGEVMMREFYDQKDGGFFFTREKTSDLIARPREGFDGALPSANSVAALSLFRLGELTAREEFADKADSTIRFFSQKIETQPSAFAFMLSALLFKLGSPKEVVFSGDRGSKEFQVLLRTFRSQFLPNSVVVLADEKARVLTPLVEGRIAEPEAQPKIFVCSENVCKLPVATNEDLLAAVAN